MKWAGDIPKKERDNVARLKKRQHQEWLDKEAVDAMAVTISWDKVKDYLWERAGQHIYFSGDSTKQLIEAESEEELRYLLHKLLDNAITKAMQRGGGGEREWKFLMT